MPKREGASRRLWSRLLRDPQAALEADLSPTDLQSLLLAVAERRAQEVTTARVMQRWRSDPFVRPSTSDPRRVSRLEADLWRLLPLAFEGVDLSPVAPFASCSALAGVHQNRVLTTTRLTEVLADPTVMLALEAAGRRRADRERPVHLAACHRVLRTQRFPPPFSQHFRLFALVSSARDRGSGRTEADMVLRHVRFYANALGGLFPDDGFEISLSTFLETAAAERLTDTVIPDLQGLPGNVTVSMDTARERGRNYYCDFALRIDLIHNGECIEIGDGGITDWTARLVPDAKERCLTSCIATERLALLRD